MNITTPVVSSLLSSGLAALLPAVSRVVQHVNSCSATPAITGPAIRRAFSTRQAEFRGCALDTSASRTAVVKPAGLHSCGAMTRGFSASACLNTAADSLSVNDVLEQVAMCAASKNTDLGVLGQLADCAIGRASELSPEQIRNLCVSFAQLGYFNTQFKSVMADAVIEKLDTFTPEQLADTAWAFGKAQYYDYDLLSNLLPYLKHNIEKFDASGMAKMLWTFARFGYQDETLMDMMHGIAVKLQENCNTRTLAEVVYAMAQLGWADGRLHNLVADYAMDNIQDFDSESLAKLAFGLAHVGYDDDALYSAITTAAAADIDSMSPEEVAMILSACGEMGHLCDKFMTAVVDQYMPANLAAFTPEQLQAAVKAWNRLGFTHPSVAKAAVRLSEVLPHLAPDFPETPATAAQAVHT